MAALLDWVGTALATQPAELWVLWFLGAVLIAGGGLGRVGARVGWLGFGLVLTGVLASWAQRAATRRLIVVGGVALAVVLALALVSLKRGSPWRRAPSPGDYEAELIELCGERKAEELIRAELQRSPTLSRVGAAMAVVTRLRVEREGLGPPL